MANTYIQLPTSGGGGGGGSVTQGTTPWIVGNAFETVTDTITALSDSVDLAFATARATVGVVVTGTWVGTIAVQVSVDGTNFTASEIIPVASGVIATAIGANGQWTVPVGGTRAIKLISTAWTSGTATITLTACTAPHVLEVYSETADNLKNQSHAAVTTSAPSYTTGTTRSLSLNTAGGLRTDGSGVTQPISAASLPLPTGAATAALQTQPGVDIGDVTVNNASGASAVNIQDGGNSITVDGTVGVSGSVVVTNTVLSVVGGGTEATAQRVTIASDSTGLLSVDDNGGSLTVDGTVAATQSGTWNITNVSGTVSLPTGAATETTSASILGKYTSATSTLSNVAASATSVTLLALNASRESAIFYNDSTSACYVKFGSTASATSFTYKLRAAETLIVDGIPVYTGIVTGIWDSATGSMRVTELT